jgi:hypothetical protein
MARRKRTRASAHPELGRFTAVILWGRGEYEIRRCQGGAFMVRRIQTPTGTRTVRARAVAAAGDVIVYERAR